MSATIEPASVTTSLRDFEGCYCDDGYEFIGAGEAAGWRAVAAWGRDGWDLGSWPYVVYLFRGELERADYCEGDIRIETYATSDERERATDAAAMFHWRGESWVEGVDVDDPPARFRGPFSWKRLEAEEVV